MIPFKKVHIKHFLLQTTTPRHPEPLFWRAFTYKINILRTITHTYRPINQIICYQLSFLDTSRLSILALITAHTMARRRKTPKTLPAGWTPASPKSKVEESPASIDAKVTSKVAEPPVVPEEPTIPPAPTATTASSPEAAETTKNNRWPTSKPLYFWGENNDTKGYLSQWHREPFYDPSEPYGNIYKTAEHYMMYHKAMLFGDKNMAAKILLVDNPRQAKQLGRSVHDFDEDVWVANRMRIVKRANYCKFTFPLARTDSFGPAERDWRLGSGKTAKTFRAASFRALLQSTGDRFLAEASPYDRIWGIGFREADAESNRENWGENLLGKALMAVREEFRKEDAELRN